MTSLDGEYTILIFNVFPIWPPEAVFQFHKQLMVHMLADFHQKNYIYN